MLTIEELTVEHLPMLHQLIGDVASERKFLGLTGVVSLENFMSNFKSEIELKSILYVAMFEQEMIGWCFIYRNRNPVYKHVGTLFMGVAGEARGLGVGTTLLDAALERAWETKLMRVALDVCEPNDQAMRLYTNAGFVVEGVKPLEYCMDGEYCDIISMGMLNHALIRERSINENGSSMSVPVLKQEHPSNEERSDALFA